MMDNQSWNIAFLFLLKELYIFKYLIRLRIFNYISVVYILILKIIYKKK